MSDTIKFVKEGEQQVPVAHLSLDVTTASTSANASKAYVFPTPFASDDVLAEAHIQDGTKNRDYKNVSVESVSSLGLTVHLQGNATLTDGTVIVKVRVIGKR